MAGEIASLIIRVGSSEVVVATGNMKAMQKAANKLALTTDKVTKSSKTLMAQQKVTASSMSSGFKVIGRDISRYVSIPFAAASASALKFASDLTSGMGQVETLIAGTGSRIYDLQDAVTSLSSETGLGFDSLTRGLYETISAFQDGEDTIGRFTAATKAAVAGNSDVLSSVKLISAVTKAYGDTSEEAAEKVTDLAFSAVKYGQTTFSELANSIQQVTATSNMMGVSMEELFSVYATLTGVTGDAAEVSTGLNRALISLMNPTATLKGLMAQYTNANGDAITSGQEFIEVMGGAVPALQEIVKSANASGTPINKYITRITGVKVALALAGAQADTFVEKSSLVADSAGAMEEAYYAATLGIDEFQRILKQVKQTLASAGAEIGQVMLPMIVTIAQQIANAAEKFSQLDESTQKTVIHIIALTAALGPLLILTGSLLRTLKLFGDLGTLMGAGGALSFLANPVILIAVASAIALVVAVMGDWYRETKLQAEALEDLKKATIGFQDATTNFNKLIESTSEMNDVAERNQVIISELAKTYGDDFASSLDLSSAGLNDIYQAMAKIEATKYQDTLETQKKQFAGLVTQMRMVSYHYDEIKKNLEKYGLSSTFEGDLEKMENALAPDGHANKVTTLIDQLKTLRSGITTTETDMKTFLDDLQSDIEQRTGGSLTLDRLYEITDTSGSRMAHNLTDSMIKTLKEQGAVVKEATTELLVIPAGEWTQAGQDAADDYNTGLGTGMAGGKAKKTWEDFFSEITGIAGEAFAYVDEESGHYVGGTGKDAADAYATAFAQEMETQNIIANAIGDSLSAGDKLDIVESQIDSVVDHLTETLNAKIATSDFNKEGLSFDIADLLSSDETSITQMLKVFNLTDDAIQGMISSLSELQKTSIDLQMSASLEEYNDALAEAVKESDIAGHTIGEDFDYSAATVEALQDRLTSLYGILYTLNDSDWLATEEGLALQERLLAIIQQTEQALEKESNTYENMISVLEGADTVGATLGDVLYDSFKRAGEGSENFNLTLAAGLSVVQGTIEAIGDGLADIASGFGEVIGQMLAGVDVAEQWDNVMGDFALSIAQTLSDLATQVGLQLIGAGAARIATGDLTGWALVGMGSAFLAGGLAGTLVTSAVESYADSVDENAQGGVYSGSTKLTKYAHGGILGDYVNSIVDKPTYFANGSAVMGEAGAEAIMPLTRTSSGDLGVQAVGSSSSGSATININNYASDTTSATATQNSDGSIDVNIIKKAVASAIADGSTDKAMKSRFGAKVIGLN